MCYWFVETKHEVKWYEKPMVIFGVGFSNLKYKTRNPKSFFESKQKFLISGLFFFFPMEKGLGARVMLFLLMKAKPIKQNEF